MISCSNALEHLESSHTKRLGVAMHWNIWSLSVAMHWNIWSLLILKD